MEKVISDGLCCIYNATILFSNIGISGKIELISKTQKVEMHRLGFVLPSSAIKLVSQLKSLANNIMILKLKLGVKRVLKSIISSVGHQTYIYY